MIARLKPGASLSRAQSQIDANNAAHAAEFPDPKMIGDAGFRTIVALLHADHVKAVRPILLLMQAGVLLLLVIGGVNLVNLLLIRASGRSRELAIRQSLGASRRHIASQVTTETVLLTLAGGLCGLAVGGSGIRLLAVVGVDQLPLGAEIAFDGRLAVVALLGAVVLGLLIAVPIVWFNLRGQLTNGLQSETRGGTATHAAQRVRHGFIVTQIALAFVLLAGAGLLGLSLDRALAVSPGFRPDHIGVLSYAVSQRRREIGMRMALGALPKQIGNHFLSLGLRLLATGTILGVIGAWLAGRAMQSILFGVPAFHLPTLAAATLILSVVSIIGCWLPALRASRVDPMEALRHE